ncbi:hypothetical protein N431DRAFT_495079 [Stipitochalara longipes BDJ]|nr:hypothetical protein N431DRAFT_495079 [Stipitochalara longipes BDJ]
MNVVEGSGLHGPRDGWSSKDAAFQFVNVNDSLKIDESTRTIIRSRATWSSYHSTDNVALDKSDRKKQMRRFRLQPPRPKASQSQVRRSPQRHSGSTNSRQILGETSRLTQDPLNGNRSILYGYTDGKLQINSLEKNQSPTSFRRYTQQDPELFLPILSGLTSTNPANALADPFDVLPLPINLREDLLLKHFFTGTAAPSLMMSYHYNLSFKKGDPMESLRYRMEAIRIVNDRLSSPEDAIRDGTICVVAGTATYEAYNGTRLGILTRMKGLQRLIDMRGGLRNGNLPLILQRVVAWADLTSANILQSTPHFGGFERANVVPPPSWPFVLPDSATTTQDPTSTSGTTLLRTFDSNLQEIFADLSKFPASEKDPEWIDHIWYSDKIYLVQRSLMHVAYSKQYESSHIDRACALAALIYVHTGLCEVRIHPKVINILILRLKTELQLAMRRSAPGSSSGNTTRKFVWALYFGGVTSSLESEREWFLNQLVTACEALGLETWLDMQAILEAIFWKDGCEQITGALWRELESKRETIYGKKLR